MGTITASADSCARRATCTSRAKESRWESTSCTPSVTIARIAGVSQKAFFDLGPLPPRQEPMEEPKEEANAREFIVLRAFQESTLRKSRRIDRKKKRKPCSK